jgi:hypothetical protein
MPLAPAHMSDQSVVQGVLPSATKYQVVASGLGSRMCVISFGYDDYGTMAPGIADQTAWSSDARSNLL